MAVINIKLPTSRDVLIPSHSANVLLDGGNGPAALLYIYILSHSGTLDVAAAGKRLKMSDDEIVAALRFLESCRLIGKAEAPVVSERSDAMPEYSQTDVAEAFGSDKDFNYLARFCEEIFGKILSTVDLKVLLGIYSWLGLPVDVICLLVTSCVDETRKKLGPGRVPTMRTIEKRAKIWLRDGVLTVGRAEEYLREQEKLGEDKTRISRILGISGRALSATEERYISAWISLGLSDELIAAAYDKTVVNTGALKWNYMDKILTAWHELGYKTVSDVETKEQRRDRAEDSSQGDESAAQKLRELNRQKRLKREE